MIGWEQLSRTESARDPVPDGPFTSLTPHFRRALKHLPHPASQLSTSCTIVRQESQSQIESTSEMSGHSEII
jgi:hypothetical protein